MSTQPTGIQDASGTGVGQTAPAAGVRTDALTVPTGVAAALLAVFACNTGSSEAVIEISIGVGGVAYDVSQVLVSNFPVLPGLPARIPIGMQLGQGDIVRVYSDVGAVSFTLNVAPASDPTLALTEGFASIADLLDYTNGGLRDIVDRLETIIEILGS